MTEEEKKTRGKKAKELRDQGLTWKQVGKEIGVSAGRACHVVDEYNRELYMEEIEKLEQEHAHGDCSCPYCPYH